MTALLALLLAAQPVPAAVIADPPRDAAHPAAMNAFVIPAPGTAAARKAGARRFDAATLPTDHAFSDMRIALATRLVTWLDGLPR